MRRALFAIVALSLAGAVHAQGLTVTTDGFEEGVNQSIRQGENLRVKREAEREAARRATEARSEGSGYGSLSCNDLYKDYQLQNYCRTGECQFYESYPLTQLCKYNDENAFAGNYTVNQYLKYGETAGFSYQAQQGAKRHASSFERRKLFTIYYVRGYILK